jgi:hypothetical protein
VLLAGLGESGSSADQIFRWAKPHKFYLRNKSDPTPSAPARPALAIGRSGCDSDDGGGAWRSATAVRGGGGGQGWCKVVD